MIICENTVCVRFQKKRRQQNIKAPALIRLSCVPHSAKRLSLSTGMPKSVCQDHGHDVPRRAAKAISDEIPQAPRLWE